ncbi:MFS transporter [Nocardiopsis prasina]|uniref:MFS transporter n=1 Tax=Nocardiopsis prasina TaxID=2015 RepID=UPI00034BAD54|nr:MFS transporter [Nocardiopsis prasina]
MTTTPPAPKVPGAPERERLSGTFHRFWAAGVSTNFGDGLLAVALPLLAATLTGDPLLVAGLTVARFLPWLLVAPLSGVLLDRVDRLRALVVSNTVAAATVALLAVALASGHATVWVLYAAMFVVMCCETISDPASRLGLTRLVPRRLLDRANSRVEGGRLVAQEFGAAPVAAVLFAVAAVIPVAGAMVSYALCAVLVGTVVVILRRRPLDHQVEEPREGDEASSRGPLRDLAEGLRYVFGDRLLRRLAACNAGTMIGLNTGLAVLVLYAGQRLELPASLYGVLVAGLAVGGVSGTFVVGWVLRRLGRRTAFLGGYLGAAAVLLGLGVTTHAAVAGLLLVGMGLCMAVSNIAGSVFFQSVVPDRIRARAGNVHRAVGWGATPVGALLGGVLGRIDLGLPYLVGGVIVGLVVLCHVRTIFETSDLCDRAVSEQESGPVQG